jgi:hypothetical protein
MALLSPGIGLILWTLLSLTNLVLCIIAMIKISNDKFIEPGKKAFWVLAIIIFPFIGALTFIAFYRKAGYQRA